MTACLAITTQCEGAVHYFVVNFEAHPRPLCVGCVAALESMGLALHRFVARPSDRRVARFSLPWEIAGRRFEDVARSIGGRL